MVELADKLRGLLGRRECRGRLDGGAEGARGLKVFLSPSAGCELGALAALRMVKAFGARGDFWKCSECGEDRGVEGRWSSHDDFA